MRGKSYILLLLVVMSHIVSAQQVLRVVTRVIEKEYRLHNEFLLEIDAEKANIDIKVVDGHSVKLHVEQSVKNANVRIAENELGAIHFVEKKERNRLYLHNYTRLEANSTGLSSIINNKYTIEIPRYCHLKIKNELGEVTVTGVSSTMRYYLNYCSLTLDDAQGKLYVDSRIGDVTLNDCQLDGDFITENVNLKLQDVGGSYDIQSQFGSLSCLMSEQVTLFNANLEQCEATLINRTSIDYTYVIDVNKAKISVLDEMLKDQIEETISKTSLHSKSDQAVGTVIIKSEYGDVNLY